MTLKHIALLLHSTKNFKELVAAAIELGIPQTSILFEGVDEVAVEDVLKKIKGWSLIDARQVRISVIGKWYTLPSKAMALIKELIGATKDYDRHFLNLFINYDAQEELFEAVKLIGMQIQAGKLAPEFLNKASIKEALATSFLLPPDLILQSREVRQVCFMLWDCNAKIWFYPGKNLSERELRRAIELFEK